MPRKTACCALMTHWQDGDAAAEPPMADTSVRYSTKLRYGIAAEQDCQIVPLIEG